MLFLAILVFHSLSTIYGWIIYPLHQRYVLKVPQIKQDYNATYKREFIDSLCRHYSKHEHV